MIDFVPMVGYGETNLVANNSTEYVVLYPLPDYVGDAEFLVEDSEENLFLERIVGQVNFSWNGAAAADNPTVSWRLMPLGMDYDALTVLEPFATPWTPRSPEWANLKWWDERHFSEFSAGSFFIPPDPIEHPYYTHVDIRPRMMLGARRNLWPVLAIRNDDADLQLQVQHRLRALYKY